MNPQTRNWIESAELYAVEFAAGLDPLTAMTDADIERVAKEQAELSIEQAEYQDGVNIEDLREYGLEDVFATAIRSARDEASKKMKPRQIKLTSAQNAVLENILAITDETYAALIRRMLTAEAAAHNLSFPQDTPTNDISKAQAKRWPKRPAPGEIVTLVIGETEFTGELRSTVTIEEADAIVSDLIDDPTQMRFNEDVRRDGASPHTMRGSYIWIEPAE